MPFRSSEDGLLYARGVPPTPLYHTLCTEGIPKTVKECVKGGYLFSKMLPLFLSTLNRLFCMLDPLLAFLNKLSSYYDVLFIFFFQCSRFVEKRFYCVHRMYLL